MALTPGWLAKEVGKVGPTLAWLGPSFVPRYPLVSYYLWLCLILDILKIWMDFGPYNAFQSSDVPEMVDQQNSWNSLVISTYLLYLGWNVGMLAVNICILWLPTVTEIRIDSQPCKGDNLTTRHTWATKAPLVAIVHEVIKEMIRAHLSLVHVFHMISRWTSVGGPCTIPMYTH
jgi:hypothetical protein